MRIIEIICLVLFFLGVLFQLMILPGGSLLIGLSMTLLACVYFYLGFLLFNGLKLRKIFKKENYIDIHFVDVIISVFAGIFLSISLIGIMFYLLLLPGSSIMLTVGSYGLCFISIVFAIIYLMNKVSAARRALIRSIPFFIFSLWVLSLGKYDWIKYRFSDYPYYI